jgi:hypothetical protein
MSKAKTKVNTVSRKVRIPTATPQKKVDPIFAVIRAYQAATRAVNDADSAADYVENLAHKKFGWRPIQLIAWRTYGHIGGGEIEKARQEFLKLPNVSRETIEAEYRDAKRRYRAIPKAQAAWDERAGLTQIRAKQTAATAAWEAASEPFATVMPTTIMGAVRLFNFTVEDQKGGELWWHKHAINAVLAAMIEAVRKYELKLSRKVMLRLVADTAHFARSPVKGGAK